MRWGCRVALVLCGFAFLSLPSASLAKDPPNPHDPCSTAGRNTCGTLGVGFYAQSRYGIRWFGDYRGAVPNEAHTFCLDLGYWYPSPSYRFRETSGPLVNRDGETVPLGNQQRMSYAVWTFGRTTDPKRQAAVMMYVHSLMGDARPGEVDPATIDKSLVPLVDQIARDSARYHGPYRIETKLPDNLVAGRPATATIRVLAASGAALPGVQLDVSAENATGAGNVQTNAAGVATVTLTPAGGADVRLSVKTEPLAATLGRVFAPTTPAAARNGQRLLVPDSQVVSSTGSSAAGKARIAISSAATPAKLLVGQPSRDTLKITGTIQDPIQVRVFGPFPSEGAIACGGTPASTETLDSGGSGTVVTSAKTFSETGWYVYQALVAETNVHNGVTTPCTDPAERFRVDVQPTLHTLVSEARVESGSVVSDRVTVSGLAGQPATVDAALYGPFPAREAVVCTGKPIWTGSLDVQADGDYTSGSYTLQTPGFYVYRESIAPQGFVRGVQSDCADEAETTAVLGHPRVETEVSDQQTQVGGSIFDRVRVTGLGVLTVPVQVQLFGPFATQADIQCSGSPYGTSAVLAKGDGTYTTPPVRLDRAGYYVYRESIVEGPANVAFTAPCADVGETTVVDAAPAVATLASAEVVLPGGTLSDRIRVTGLGGTPAKIDVDLFGPFASRDAVHCSGKAFWHGQVAAPGDGVLHSPAVPVEKVGFYTFRERVVGAPHVAAATTDCPLDVETALARPLIITGRGDTTRYVAAPPAGPLTPRTVRIDSVGIHAPVLPAAIDVPHGVLGVTPNIHHTGWWVDGMAPGATVGSILIAGHVDSAAAGPGAFFRLKDAHPGDRVEVVTAGGRTFAYRVVSIRSYLKEKLPTNVYSRHGPARLVLVTCGGPFDPQKKHYRDNIVLTAVPLH